MYLEFPTFFFSFSFLLLASSLSLAEHEDLLSFLHFLPLIHRSKHMARTCRTNRYERLEVTVVASAVDFCWVSEALRAILLLFQSATLHYTDISADSLPDFNKVPETHEAIQNKILPNSSIIFVVAIESALCRKTKTNKKQNCKQLEIVCPVA